MKVRAQGKSPARHLCMGQIGGSCAVTGKQACEAGFVHCINPHGPACKQ